MRVYRYLCEEELKAILDGEMKNIGRRRFNNHSNNHHYKTGVKYLHFFKHLKDLQDIRMIKQNEDNTFYVGVFDIPLPTLLAYSGKGYYEAHGYDVNYITIREYAVPSDKIKPDQLLFYMQDKERDVTHQEVRKCINKYKSNTSSLKPASPYELKRENMILSPTKEAVSSLIESGVINAATTMNQTKIEEKVQ